MSITTGVIHWTPDNGTTWLPVLPGQPGPPGEPGLPGATGPEGPMGPPGGAYMFSTWKYNSNTSPPPATGYFKANNAALGSATTLYISETDDGSVDRSAAFGNVVAGDKVVVTAAGVRVQYAISVIADSGTYRTLTVTVESATGTAPGNNEVCTLYFVLAAYNALQAPGGTAGQILTKDSAAENDVSWQDAPVALPVGGTTGQVLAKASNADGDADWVSLGGNGYAADVGAVTAETPVTITHSLGMMDVAVEVFEKTVAQAGAAAGQVVEPEIALVDANSLTLTFAESAVANKYRVVVLKQGVVGGGGGSTILIPDMSGWTNLGTPGAWDTTTFGDGSLYFDAAAGASLTGKIVRTSIPAFPYTIEMEIASAEVVGNYQRCGGIALSATGSFTSPLYCGSVYESTTRVRAIRYSGLDTFVAYAGSSYPASGSHQYPLRLKVVLNSSTSVSFGVSTDGYLWTPILTNYTPTFTVAQVAICGSEEGSSPTRVRITRIVES